MKIMKYYAATYSITFPFPFSFVLFFLSSPTHRFVHRSSPVIRFHFLSMLQCIFLRPLLHDMSVCTYIEEVQAAEIRMATLAWRTRRTRG